MANSYLLTQEDILDMPAFVKLLCDSDDPVSRHLQAFLRPELLQRLERHSLEGFVPANPTRQLLAALNDLIQRQSIYDAPSFKYVRLTSKTQALAKRRLSGDKLVLANRLLLTEAYPSAVRLVYDRDSKDRRESDNWRRFYVEKYAKLRKDYDSYARLLQTILKDACKALAPLAIVEARPKTISSYAKKVLGRAYDNPICQTTDLAAARVITETQEQVAQVCEFIKRTFVIDEANSIDHRDRLKADEFGYLAVHYIVMLSKERVADLAKRGIVTDAQDTYLALAGRKAEIQVKTILQHAYATISHDRVYKSPFTVPEDLQRDLARIAALLEDADIDFGATVNSIEAYQGSYGAHMDRGKREEELETLQRILTYEPEKRNKPAAALDLAKLKKAVWDWRGVVDALGPYRGIACPDQWRLWTEYGYALCRLNRKDPDSHGYEDGMQVLEAAVHAIDADPTRVPKRVRVQAHSCLAWAYGNKDDRLDDARDEYRQAYDIDQLNPYMLASYLEFEISTGTDRKLMRHMQHALHGAAETCRKHARAGVELPWAYFTMGRLYLLAETAREGPRPANMPYDALAAYCKAIHLCREQKECYLRDALDDEVRFLRNIGKRYKPDDDQWVYDLVMLALYVNHKADDAWEYLESQAKRPTDFANRIVIVSGATHPDEEARMRGYRGCLFSAFEDFEGSVISGGTRAGIPGLVGEMADHLRARGLSVRARCYRPSTLPANGPRDDRYDEAVPDVGELFSPRQSLQTWIDLVVAGVDPSKVKLLGINGGPLTAFEYKLALAMGAKVGVIRESGRAAKELAPDQDWRDARNLLWLPCDPMTVWAFVVRGTRAIEPYMVDMGKEIHRDYTKPRWKQTKEREMRPWEYLDPDMQESNIEQAAYAESILRRAGYSVEPAQGKIDPYRFPPEEDDNVERMAEMEHGRWNVERLGKGWKYGPKKDTARLVNPCIKPWKDLTDEERSWDCEFVRKWPTLLAKVGRKVSPPPRRGA